MLHLPEVDGLFLTKNTFIEFAFADRTPSSTRRSQSLPCSPRQFFPEDDAPNFQEFKIAHGDSEPSTDCDLCTEASDDDGDAFAELQLFPVDAQYTLNVDAPVFVPNVMREASVCQTCTPLRLSSSAAAFKPVSQEQPEPIHYSYKESFSSVLNSVTEALHHSNLTRAVEVSEDSQDCYMIIKLSSEGDDLKEDVLSLTKEALLGAASQSKSVYVLGYCAPNPFNVTSQGFEATLGVMENAPSACWHLYKKGFCRHDVECNKAHPVCKLTLRVLVETASFHASVPEVIDFKMQVADLVSAVLSNLKQQPHVGGVKAFRSVDTQCWSIEISPKDDNTRHKDYVTMLAKNAFYDATKDSDPVCMMGYDAKPFTNKPDGFLLVLASMRARSKACWNFLSLGICKRECTCRWEHPTCFMPINVVVKTQRRF
jgi:hypothetical protein